MDRVNCEVLIIGAGGAGCRAGIEAARAGREVVIISKGPMGITGITPIGFTGYTAICGQDPEDSPDLLMKDTIVAGHFLNDQNLVRVLAENSQKSLLDLESFGLNFQKAEGRYVLRDVPGMSRPRMLVIPSAGVGFIGALVKEVAKHTNIRLLDYILIISLYLVDGRAVGAVGMDCRRGTMVHFNAKAIILATGGAEQMWPTTDCPSESTGDGCWLAWRVGAKVVDMEQQLFYPTVMVHPPFLRGLEISYETILYGGVITNRLDQIVADRGEKITRDKLANRICKEISEGRGGQYGGLYIDLTKAPPDAQEWIEKRLPAFKRLRFFGVDPRKERLEVVPAAHTTLGGIYIDEKCQTGVEGLYACGECAANVHGANRLPGQAWLDIQVFGTIAGAEAAGFAKNHDRLDPDRSEVQAARDLVEACLVPRPGQIRPYLLKDAIKKIMGEHVGLRRTEKELERALKELNALDEQLPRMGASSGLIFNKDLIDAIEIHAMINAAKMTVLCAALRKESRGCHFREDYPMKDPQGNLYHTVMSKEKGKMFVHKNPVNLAYLQPYEVEQNETV